MLSCEPWTHSVTATNALVLGIVASVSNVRQEYPPICTPQTNIRSSWLVHCLGLWVCLLQADLTRELANTKSCICIDEVIMEQREFSGLCRL